MLGRFDRSEAITRIVDDLAAESTGGGLLVLAHHDHRGPVAGEQGQRSGRPRVGAGLYRRGVAGEPGDRRDVGGEQGLGAGGGGDL
jgi:hypothetical protein